MKETKVDELNDEELEKFLEDNRKENQEADNDYPENKEEETVEITEEITVLPPRQEKLKQRQKTKEEKRVEKLRQAAIRNIIILKKDTIFEKIILGIDFVLFSLDLLLNPSINLSSTISLVKP